MTRFLLAIGFIFLMFSHTKVKAEPITKQSVQKWFDHEIPKLHKKHHVVGSVVSVVYKGKLLFSKGYGYKDRAKKTPVDPAKTLFRVGSISKLFTWTAIMQLVEQGKLKLNQDINRYLSDIKIPPTYKQPITLYHLMGHTPGFEDQLIGLFSDKRNQLLTLKQVVSRRILRRVRPPGVQLAYSNYGVMLAGYMLEKVTKVPFENYIQEHIFRPLGMENSTFRQPLPKRLAENMASGYSYGKKKYQLRPFEYVQGTPAGGMSSTANDMAKFLLAHLAYGRVGEKKILEQSTAKKSYQCHFRQMPKAPCFAHGWIELLQGSDRYIGHGGDTIYFHSFAFLSHKHQFGLFLSNNTSTGMPVNFELMQHWLDVLSANETGKQLAKRRNSSPKNLSPFAGSYHTNRRSESTFMKMLSLFMRITVKAQKDGLQVFDFLTQKYLRFVQIEPLIFQQEDGSRRLFFAKNKQGEVTQMLDSVMPVMLFIKPPWYESFLWNTIVLLLAVLSFCVGFLLKPTGLHAFFSRKKARVRMEKWAGYVGFGHILFVIFYFVILLFFIGDNPVFTVPHPSIYFLPYPLFVSTMALIGFAILSWWKQYWGLLGRIHYSVLALAALGFSWFLLFWKFA